MFAIRKFDLLVALYIFCICVSNLMGAKTFPVIATSWLTLNTSVAIFTVPIVFTINDMITEVYGRERTRSVIRAGLVVVGITLLFSLLATALPPSTRFAEQEAAYDAVFGLSARMAFASLTAFAIAEFTDLWIFTNIRKRMGGNALWLRNNVSNFIAQLLDTAVFMVLAFWSLERGFGDNVGFLLSISIPYWLVKCAMSVLETPLVYAGVSWLKKDENIQ